MDNNDVIKGRRLTDTESELMSWNEELKTYEKLKEFEKQFEEYFSNTIKPQNNRLNTNKDVYYLVSKSEKESL